MKKINWGALKSLLALRWKPGRDILVVCISWILVVCSLYTATVIVGAETGGGIPYFLLYAVLTAAIFGIGIPLVWMVIIQKRPLKDLGITKKRLFRSLVLQLVFSIAILTGGFSGLKLPVMDRLIPLICLSLAIGLFEAIFWRGWVLMRLEEAFGFIPAALLGSVLYALYHIGYDMPLNEIAFLFFIGLMYSVVFRLIGSIFILWPLFQPGGQLITLIKEGLELPLLASLGFLEVLIVMGLMVWFASKFLKKNQFRSQTTKQTQGFIGTKTV
jgi:hypothetical protein